MKLKTLDLSYFLDRFFFGLDGFQSIFVYQPKFSELELKEKRALIMLLTGHEKRCLYTSKLKPLYPGFVHSVKLSGYRIEIQFNKSILVVK